MWHWNCWLYVPSATENNTQLCLFSFVVFVLFKWHVQRTRLRVHSPAATAEHMTKNIPTAILFREEGSRPRRFRIGSTTLSFRGISMIMSTASNMVSQAGGKRNVIWGIQGEKHGMKKNKRQKSMKTTQFAKCLHSLESVHPSDLILLWHPQVVESKTWSNLKNKT